MAKALGLVTILAFLALLGWWLLRPGQARGTRGAPEEAPATAAEPAVELAPASAPVATESGAGRITREAGGLTSPVEPTPPGRMLTVHVRDERGAPLARLLVRGELATPGRGTSSTSLQLTGAAGLATFEWPATEQLSSASGALLQATLEGLFTPPVTASVAAEPWPTAPLELVVPAHGAVVVRVRDERGQPLAAGEVALVVVREFEPGARLWSDEAHVSATLTEGEARFEPIATGLKLRARCGERPAHTPVELEFAGPQRAGELVAVELALPEPPPRLGLRVLAPDGRPLAEAELQANLIRRMNGGSFSNGETRHTDAAGRLEFTLQEVWNEGEQRELELVFTPPGAPAAHARLDLSREFPPGQRELGDVRLVERPVLVAGRVLEPDGAPAKGVSVEVQRSYGQDGNGEPWWGGLAWSEVQEDGTFAFYEEAPEEPLQLLVSSPVHEPLAPLPIVPGTRGLEILVRRGVGLHGRVRLPEGFPAGGIEVHARGAGEFEPRSAPLGADGAFDLTGLAPGSYDVEFALSPTGERVLTIPGVVAPGSAEGDARLAEVDLTGLVRCVRLTVRASDGTLAAGGWVSVEGTPEGQQDVAFVIEAGVAVLLVPASGSDVVVRVPGHRLLALARLASEREVQLAGAFRIRLELPPEVELPSNGSLQLRLLPGERGGQGSRGYSLYRGHEQAGWFSTAFGGPENTFTSQRRALELEIQETGTYAVTFYLVRGDPSGSSISFSLPAGAPSETLTLDEASAGRSFVVQPDPGTYAGMVTGG